MNEFDDRLDEHSLEARAAIKRCTESLHDLTSKRESFERAIVEAFQKKIDADWSKEMPSGCDLVMILFQGWGQSGEQRKQLMDKLKAYCNVKPEQEDEFRKDLGSCWPLGKLQTEEKAMDAVISKWRSRS